MSKIGRDAIKQKRRKPRFRSSSRFKEPWKENIDYAVRNITTGDEEETRLVEDPETYIKGWKEEGVSSEDHKKLTRLLRAAVRRSKDGEDYTDLMNDILRVLKKYMSHKDLYSSNYDSWERYVLHEPQERKFPVTFKGGIWYKGASGSHQNKQHMEKYAQRLLQEHPERFPPGTIMKIVVDPFFEDWGTGHYYTMIYKLPKNMQVEWSSDDPKLSELEWKGFNKELAKIRASRKKLNKELELK